MNTDSIRNTVMNRARRLCSDTGVEAPLETATRLGALGLDSVKLVELIFELERELGVVASEDLLAQVETLGDVIALFESAAKSPMPA